LNPNLQSGINNYSQRAIIKISSLPIQNYDIRNFLINCAFFSTALTYLLNKNRLLAVGTGNCRPDF